MPAAITTPAMESSSTASVKKITKKNQSPRQKWRSTSFAYAQKQMSGAKTPEQRKALEADYMAANGLTPFGSHAATPQGWKQSCLMFEWQQQNPFETCNYSAILKKKY